MNPAIFNSQFIQVALPIVLSLFIAAWMNGRSFDGIIKRLDDLRLDMNRKFDAVNRRLERIDDSLRTHIEKFVFLEERTSPFARRA